MTVVDQKGPGAFASGQLFHCRYTIVRYPAVVSCCSAGVLIALVRGSPRGRQIALEAATPVNLVHSRNLSSGTPRLYLVRVVGLAGWVWRVSTRPRAGKRRRSLSCVKLLEEGKKARARHA